MALNDLAAVDALIGEARVIGFAEYGHLQPEGLAFRNRLFQHLVQSRGVTALAAETSFVESIAADDYVLGHGPDLPSAEAVHGAFSWSPLVAEENRRLLEWMRAYNAAHPAARPLRFLGIDLTGYRPDEDLFGRARRGADIALAYAAGLEPQAAPEFRRRLEPGLSRFTRSKYATLSVEERDALTVALRDLESLFDQRRPRWVVQTSSLEYERAHRSLRVALQHDADFRTDAHGGSAAREAAMAENLRWALEQQGRGGRILVFASFDHLTKGPNPRFEEEQLGAHLTEEWGEDYVAIGSYWLRNPAEHPRPTMKHARLDAGERADELLRPAAMGRTNAISFLDLRSRPVDARWLTGRGIRSSFFDAMIILQVHEAAPRW